MNELTFADGFGSIAIIGATVRIDLVTLLPGDDGPTGRPKPSLSNRLVMPIEGFLAAAGQVAEAAEAIRKMGNAGRAHAPEAAKTGEPAPAAVSAAQPATPAADVAPRPTPPKRHFP